MISDNSGLFVNASDCEYCAAWPSDPCALHPSTTNPPSEGGNEGSADR